MKVPCPGWPFRSTAGTWSLENGRLDPDGGAAGRTGPPHRGIVDPERRRGRLRPPLCGHRRGAGRRRVGRCRRRRRRRAGRPDRTTGRGPRWRRSSGPGSSSGWPICSSSTKPRRPSSAALDNGTPISVMNPGRYAAAWVRYYAGWCDKLDGEMMSAEPGLSFVRLEPYGVVAVIPPWNGSMMGMGQKCGPALAAGNAVVAKPPELAPFGMLRFAELALEAGLPAGRAQRGGRRGRGRGGAGRASRGGQDQLHRWWHDRPGADGAGGPQPHPAGPRARRQVTQHRLPRRRPRDGGGQRLLRDGAADRAGMRAPHPALRSRRRVRRDGGGWSCRPWPPSPSGTRSTRGPSSVRW